MKIPIANIQIGERQRLDLGDLADLDSMIDPEVQQILPIVVHKTPAGYELVDGRRRIERAIRAGWTEIDATEKETLSHIQKQKMEFFADVARKDRTWQERCLTLYKLHNILKREKRQAGEDWFVSATASLVGISKSPAFYMLQVAEALLREPHDEEIWTSAGYIPALKVLVERQFEVTNKELERRRQLMNSENSGCLPPGTVAQINNAASIRSILSEESTPERITVYICGTNMDFMDAVPGKDFITETYYAVLGYGLSLASTRNVLEALRPEGFAVLWSSVVDTTTITRKMPFLLIWNKIVTAGLSQWPFIYNYGFAHVLAGQPPSQTYPNPSTAVIAAMPDGDELPHTVVDFSLRAVSPPNVAVLCLNGINPVHIAQLGQVPVFFEPDKERFDAKVAALKAFYEETIPNVEIKIR